MENRPLVVIESPYRGDVEANLAFADAVGRYALDNGFAPWAMAPYYTRLLRDEVPNERELGIRCGLLWSRHADEIWFCLRQGEQLSEGMSLAFNQAIDLQKPYRILRFTQDGVPLTNVF